MAYTNWKTDYGTTFKITDVEISYYSRTGNTAILLYNREEGPIATATIGVAEHIDPRYVAIDTNNCGESICNWLYENNIITSLEPEGYVYSGYCAYPVYRLAVEV